MWRENSSLKHAVESETFNGWTPDVKLRLDYGMKPASSVRLVGWHVTYQSVDILESIITEVSRWRISFCATQGGSDRKAIRLMGSLRCSKSNGHCILVWTEGESLWATPRLRASSSHEQGGHRGGADIGRRPLHVSLIERRHLSKVCPRSPTGWR